MKKTGAIILSMMLVFMMTVTNLAGAYQSAARVFAAEEEIICIAEKQDEVTAMQSADASKEVAVLSAPENTAPEIPQENPPATSDVTTPENTHPVPENALPAPDTSLPESGTSLPEPVEGREAEQNSTPAVTFTVTFNANGHGTAPAAVTVENGGTITKPEEPTTDGFTFTGWFHDADATLLWYFDTDTVTENITLYAGWAENASAQTQNGAGTSTSSVTAPIDTFSAPENTLPAPDTSHPSPDTSLPESGTSLPEPVEGRESGKDTTPASADTVAFDANGHGTATAAVTAFPAFSQSATAGGITVTAKAEEGAFPEGARLSVSAVYGNAQAQAEQKVEQVRQDDANVATLHTLDIKVLDADGEELQPANGYEVELSFSSAQIADENTEVSIYHIDGNHVQELAVSTSGSTATAVTGGFSFYVVRLSYNNSNLHYDFGRNGEHWTTWISIENIRTAIGLPSGPVTNLTSSHSHIIEARQNVSGVWGVQCQQEQIPAGVFLTVTIDSVAYRIDVDNAPPNEQGTYNNFHWALFSVERVLVLSGTGSVGILGQVQELPWYSSQSTLQEVIIEEGITYVSSSIFVHAAQLTTVHLPLSLSSITWNSSGDGCDNLRKFIYPGTKVQWQNVSGYDSMPQDKYVQCSDGIFSNIKNNVTLALKGTDSSSNDTVEVAGITANSSNTPAVVQDIAYGDSVTVKVTTDKNVVQSVMLVYSNNDTDTLKMTSHDGTSEFYRFTMPRSAVTLRVTFEATTAHKITTVINGKGTVKIAALEGVAAKTNAYAGEKLHVYLTPEEGYQNMSNGVNITNLEDNSIVNVGEMSAYYPFTMPDAPIKVEVKFMASFNDITANYDASMGKVMFGKSASAASIQTDQPVSLQVLPNAGVVIESISYTWNGHTHTIPVSGQEYTFPMPPADTEVDVVFKEESGMPVITTTPANLLQGTVGEEYRYVLQADGDQPITWSWSKGKNNSNNWEHPPGLSLSEDGVISGTPTKQDTWEEIEIKAKNAKGEATFKTKLIVLQYFNVTAVAEPAEGGIVTGSGKCQYQMPYTLNATPNSGYDFIGWYDSNDQVLSYHTEYRKSMGWGDETVTAKFVPHVDGAPVIKTTSLPNGAETISYEHTLTADGDAPIEWSVVKGDFPPGLTLSEDGKISGTPTSWNTYVFTVQATNTKGTVFRELTLRINSAPSASASSIDITLTNNDATKEAPDWVTGDKGTASATVSPAGALQDVTWSSSDPSVLTIDQDGNVIVNDDPVSSDPYSFTNNWDVTITATAIDGSGVSTTQQITVKRHAHTVRFHPENGTTGPFIGGGSEIVYDSGRSKAYMLPGGNRFLPPVGKAFKAWRVNGTEYQPGDTITLSGRCSITDVYAVWEDFTPQVYRITVQTTGNGTAEAQASISAGQGYETVQSALQGTSIWTHATPDNGYVVSEATYSYYDGSTMREVSLIDPKMAGLSHFTMPAADVTIKVTFVPGGLRLTDLSVSPGTLSPAFDQNTLSYDVTVAHDVSEIQATVSFPENTDASGDTGNTWKWESGDTTNRWKTFSHTLDYGINKLQLVVFGAASGGGTYYYLNVTREPAPNAPKITTAFLPDGEENSTYVTTALAADNAANATWSLVSGGDLPAGLSLSADGKISGTPTQAGTYSFIVKAENTDGYDTKEFTIKVNPAPVQIYTVTYQVINGTWDGSDANKKTEQVEEGHTPANIPIGMQPDNGYEGGAWDTNPSGVVITAPVIFTYSFTAKPVTPTVSYSVGVSVAAGQSGWGSVSGAGSYHENADATVTATPNTGYKFVCWKENGTQVSTDAAYTFKVTKDRNLVAEFAEDGTTPTPQPPTQYSVTVTATHGGTVTGGGTFNENASVMVEAKPDAGYQFKQWTENGAKVDGAGASYTFTLTADRTLTAEFEPIPQTITGVTVSPATADVVKGGIQKFTASVSGTGMFNSAVTWTIAPVSGTFSDTGTSIDPDTGILTIGENETATQIRVTATSKEDTSVSGSAIVTVKEKPQNKTFAVSFDSDGGSAVATQYVPDGAVATKPAEPTRKGYTFVEWQLNGTAYDFTSPVTSDITLKAKWTPVAGMEHKVDVRGFSDADIPQSLKDAGYGTVATIKNALLQAVVSSSGAAYSSNYALYEVKLMVSLDGGNTWIIATPENFPSDGITVILPYPTGTGRTTHNFSVAHMFTVAMRGHLPGQTETPPVTKTDNGIRVTLDGLSPVLVSWTEVTNSKPSNPSMPTNPVNPSQPSNPGTNNNNGTANNTTNNTETAGIAAVINDETPTAIQTGTTTARSTTGQQVQNARMAQTGDDLYEHLGIHTMAFLFALTMLIASLRKVAEEKGMVSVRRRRR